MEALVDEEKLDLARAVLELANERADVAALIQSEANACQHDCLCVERILARIERGEHVGAAKRQGRE